MKQTEAKDASLAGRIFRMETLIFFVGIGCIVGGVVRGQLMSIFYGICIIIGSIALHFVKKKDWKKHWEEQERVRQAYEARMAEEKRNKQEEGK